MARLSECHQTLVNGEGKCSVPMWDGYGMPADFCNRPAYGERADWHRDLYRHRAHVPALACDWHGGPKAKSTNAEETAP